ncbi:hypothetical protein TNCV_2640251 [Trichonephila clavipes]|nr:hypothetical protein TNCV_2640251 [Trichonephila clavipes]
MDVCKYMVHLRHGGTLNSRRATSPLVRLVAPDPPGCSALKLGWNRAKSYCHLNGAQSYSLALHGLLQV